MATYQHGVYNQEQATSLTTPIQSSAALQVIFGTAPIHLADDPAKAANTPKLCYSFAECQAAVGYSDDFENFTLCQSIDVFQSTLPVRGATAKQHKGTGMFCDKCAIS